MKYSNKPYETMRKRVILIYLYFSLAMDCEIFENEFFGPEAKDAIEEVQAINSTPILIDMQKYIHRLDFI